jgi:putative phosphoribosyl transferase
MIARRPIFVDRKDAGRKLAAALKDYAAEDPLVLALPRGGVPVAAEVAQALNAPLDLLFVRKIGAPGRPELGLGAVVDGADPQIVLNEALLREVDPPPGYIEMTAHRELEEIERRRAAYVGEREPIPVHGRTVILVDDGVATGGTVRAALRALRKAGARRVILAVPVAPEDVLDSLRAEADEVVVLATPRPFHAVGLWYQDFTQTSDQEVVQLLARAGEQAQAH